MNYETHACSFGVASGTLVYFKTKAEKERCLASHQVLLPHICVTVTELTELADTTLRCPHL